MRASTRQSRKLFLKVVRSTLPTVIRAVPTTPWRGFQVTVALSPNARSLPGSVSTVPAGAPLGYAVVGDVVGVRCADDGCDRSLEPPEPPEPPDPEPPDPPEQPVSTHTASTADAT